MKKLLFSVGLISALSFQTNAQTNQVLDATFKVNEDPNFNFTSTLGEIDDAVFDYYYDGKSKFLAKYTNGKEVKSLELDKKTSKFKRNAFRGRDFFFLADDHIFEVVMNRDKDDKNYYIVSYDSNLKASRPTLLLTTTGKVRFTEGSENLIVIEETAYSTTGFEMNISKIDANLDLQLVEKVKIDKASGNNFNLNDLKVVDNQLAFIGVETNDDDELIRSEFFKYDLNTDQETRFDIDYKALNQNISDYKFNIIGNKLLIKGFMGEEPKKKFLGGVFTYNYNLEDGSLIKLNTQEFDKKFLFQNYDEKTIKRLTKRYEKKKDNPLMLFPFKIIDNKLLEDGSSIIIGEYYQHVITTTTDANGRTTTKDTYYHRDLLYSKIDAEGKILWTKKLTRALTSSFDAFGEIFSHIKDDQLFIVYADMFNVNAAKVDLSTGEYETSLVFHRKELKKCYTDFRVTPEIKEDHFALQLHRRNRSNWAIEVNFKG